YEEHTVTPNEQRRQGDSHAFRVRKSSDTQLVDRGIPYPRGVDQPARRRAGGIFIDRRGCHEQREQHGPAVPAAACHGLRVAFSIAIPVALTVSDTLADAVSDPVSE